MIIFTVSKKTISHKFSFWQLTAIVPSVAKSATVMNVLSMVMSIIY